MLDPCVANPSVNDYGCGYGGLIDALSSRLTDFSYCGYDVSEPMLAVARGELHPEERDGASSRIAASYDARITQLPAGFSTSVSLRLWMSGRGTYSGRSPISPRSVVSAWPSTR